METLDSNFKIYFFKFQSGVHNWDCRNKWKQNKAKIKGNDFIKLKKKSLSKAESFEIFDFCWRNFYP